MRSCATIVARTVYTSRMTTFSVECLHRLRPRSDTRLDNATWRPAGDAGVALHRPTHRGCRAGAHKQRTIQVITTSRLTTLTKPPVTFRGNNNIQVPCGKWDLLVVVNTNIRSVVPKITELSEVLKLNSADIATITETWCRVHVPDESICVPGYFHIRKDRADRRGGGVMCFVKHGIPFKEWTELRNNDMETLWISLRPHKLPRQFTHINVAVIYHPPIEDNNIMVNHICHCLDYILQRHPHTGIILSGDFKHLPERYLKTHYRLKQIVTVRIRGDATLDKIYTNMDKLYGQPHTSCPVGNADHNVVIREPLVDLKCITGHRQIVTTKIMGQNERVMFASDLKKIKWEDLYHLPCEKQLQMFTSSINELTDKHFPTKTVVRHTTDKPWVSDRFRYLIRRRQHAWKADDQALYRLYRNKVNRIGKSLKQQYYDKHINGLKTSNLRNWWKCMKELLGCQQTSSDPPLLHLANQVCDGNLLELSQRINNFFKPVSDLLPALSADNDYLQLEIPCGPSKYVIPVEKVEKQLHKLDTSKAPGPDSVPSWILKEFSELLAGPVAAIYNSSLREGHFPPYLGCCIRQPPSEKETARTYRNRP